MDVIRLLEPDEDNRQLIDVCVVTDDLNQLVPKNHNHFVMYIVCKENTEFKPFRIIQLEKNEIIQRISSEEALNSSLPLWTSDSLERPHHRRKTGEILELHLWRFKDSIQLSWIRFNKKEKTQRPSRIQTLEPTTEKTFLVLPVKKTSIMVLDDAGFEKYKISNQKLITRNLNCSICQENNESAFRFMDHCGHVYCLKCCFSFITKECPICRIEFDVQSPKIIKFRDGPCPLDNCDNRDLTKGAFLIPCGCHVPCEMLSSQIHQDSDQIETLKALPNCPFSMCRRKIKKIVRIYN